MRGKPRHAVPSFPENMPCLSAYAITGVALRPGMQLLLVPHRSNEVQYNPLPRSLFESILHFLESLVEVGIIFFQLFVILKVGPPSNEIFPRMAFPDLL